MMSSMLLKEELIRYGKYLGVSRAHPILVRMTQYPRRQGPSRRFLSMVRVPGCCEGRATGRRKLERKKIWESLSRARKSSRVPSPGTSRAEPKTQNVVAAGPPAPTIRFLNIPYSPVEFSTGRHRIIQRVS